MASRRTARAKWSSTSIASRSGSAPRGPRFQDQPTPRGASVITRAGSRCCLIGIRTHRAGAACMGTQAASGSNSCSAQLAAAAARSLAEVGVHVEGRPLEGLLGVVARAARAGDVRGGDLRARRGAAATARGVLVVQTVGRVDRHDVVAEVAEVDPAVLPIREPERDLSSKDVVTCPRAAKFGFAQMASDGVEAMRDQIIVSASPHCFSARRPPSTGSTTLRRSSKRV
jgi:hypothetical protein